MILNEIKINQINYILIDKKKGRRGSIFNFYKIIIKNKIFIKNFIQNIKVKKNKKKIFFYPIFYNLNYNFYFKKKVFFFLSNIYIF